MKLFIVLVLLYSINSIWTATPFKDCGSELATVQSFQVTDCDAAPCKLVKGKTYSMNLTFTAKAPSDTASVALHGVIAGVPVPFPLNDSNACDMGVKCPLKILDANTASFSLPVLTTYPSISLYVKLEVKADTPKQDYVCLLFPATLTDGSTRPKNLVGSKKGKLFEMLD